MEEACIQVYNKSGQLVVIGPFISLAEKFSKIVDLDKGVIIKVLEHIRRTGILHAIAVNLSIDTIKNVDFHIWLEKLINNNPVVIKQLVFSFSAYAVAKELDIYRNFIEVLHQWGGRAMIKRFESQSISSELVKKLKPDFIRFARDIGNGISLSRQKYEFIQTMHYIGILLNIILLAENIQTDEDYETLKVIGIEGASR
jgi:EAL domain-containing protein (putative c-di-GMP-specific phosphodiesterase class I)